MQIVQGLDGRFYKVADEDEVTIDTIDKGIEFHKQQVDHHAQKVEDYQLARATMLTLSGADDDNDDDEVFQTEAEPEQTEEQEIAASDEPKPVHKINITQITDEPSEQNAQPEPQQFVG